MIRTVVTLLLFAGAALAHDASPSAVDASSADADSAGADSVDARMQGWLAHPQRVAHAIRAAVPPVIDGVVDDAVWLLAPLQEGFTQEDPDAGEPASQRTTFQVAYDDEALYVAGVCYDSRPDSIVAHLSRRDDWLERDIFYVALDPHHDHQTGVYFAIGPSGWIEDGLMYDDGNEDDSWDGVVKVRTARRNDGWSVELEVPYHVLRFGRKDSYTWGINVLRKVSRRAEWSHWAYKPRGVNGWISRFGHLEGIEGIEPRRSLEVFPFLLGRGSLSPREDGAADERDLFSTFGADVRYGITSNISLNATVNPDFGQVEADPAVLNLGVFETFYSERRPFFVEGIQLFETPGPGIVGIDRPARLFHSRRIGRQPSRFDPPGDSDEVHRPDNTTILGAAKVSGKTEGRTAFGILNAVTGSEHVRIDEYVTDAQTGRVDTLRRRFKAEPLTNYFIGRVQQDLLTNSTVGAQLTAVNGEGFDPAYVGAADVHVKWWDNAWRVYSRVAVSRAGQEDERDTGWEGVFYFSKFSGAFGGQAYVDARSPEFDVNDLGFMDRNDRVQSGAHVFYEKLDPYWFARHSGFNLNLWQQWNFDGDRLARGVDLNMWHDLHNYWGFWMGLDRSFGAWDDLGTRGGPVMRSPGSTRLAMDLWSDDRKTVSGWAGWNVRWSRGGDNLSTWVGTKASMRPASQFEIEIQPSYSFRRDVAQWIENVDSDGDDEDDRFIFGELENRVFDLGLRGTYAATPGLSLQLFVQPFVTTGDYGAIRELARPRSYEFAPYDGLDENPDFHRRSLRFNLVLRWEYRPGSTLFAVWQQNRDRDFDDTRDPDFKPVGDLGRAFTDNGDNIFLVKINRWIGL